IVMGAKDAIRMVTTFGLSTDESAIVNLNGQPAWRFCEQCFGLFFNGDPDSPLNPGRCTDTILSDGGVLQRPHNAQGFVFYLPHDLPPPTEPAGQSGWRFCDKCFGMFFNTNEDPDDKGTGLCPAGGAHRPAGFHFALPHNKPESEGQSGWRFCDKCFGMFF